MIELSGLILICTDYRHEIATSISIHQPMEIATPTIHGSFSIPLRVSICIISNPPHPILPSNSSPTPFQSPNQHLSEACPLRFTIKAALTAPNTTSLRISFIATNLRRIPAPSARKTLQPTIRRRAAGPGRPFQRCTGHFENGDGAEDVVCWGGSEAGV